MNDDAVIKKEVAISALEIKDAKVRRLFIIANGERTFLDICELCHISKDEGIEIVKVLSEGGYVSVDEENSQEPSIQIDESLDDNNSYVFTSEFIDKLIDEMTNHVGPIASILVGNFASSGQRMLKTDLEAKLNELVEDIEDREEQEKLLSEFRNLL